MSKNTKTITEKMARLREMAEWFEGEDFTPELAVDKFRTAQELAAEIEEELTTVKNEVTIIKQKFNEG